MRRGDVGVRPLLVQVIKRLLAYHNKIITRDSAITKEALMFENNNNIIPNFVTYIGKFNLEPQQLLKLKKKSDK